MQPAGTTRTTPPPRRPGTRRCRVPVRAFRDASLRNCTRARNGAEATRGNAPVGRRSRTELAWATSYSSWLG
eukprot:299794-Chlamydomonas_euryale.AAC.1